MTSKTSKDPKSKNKIKKKKHIPKVQESQSHTHYDPKEYDGFGEEESDEEF